MKKRILLLLAFVPLAFLANAQQAGVRVLDKIIPNGLLDNYPTHVDSLGRGGLVTAATWQERNSIPVQRRKAGMIVRVKSATVDSTYSLGTGLTNADWAPYSAGVDISGKANVNGSNATGTWPISITGNAVTWSGLDFSADTGTPPSSILGYYNSGVAVRRVLKSDLQTFADVNNGATLNNSISGSAAQWNGNDYTLGEVINPSYFITGLGASNWGYSSASQLKTALATSLQDVTNVNSVTTNSITAPTITTNTQNAHLFGFIGNNDFRFLNNGSAFRIVNNANTRELLKVDNGGGVTVDDKFTVENSIAWGTGTYEGGKSKLYNTAINGTLLTSKTGTSTDFTLTNGEGVTVFDVLPGTSDTRFYGNMSIAGNNVTILAEEPELSIYSTEGDQGTYYTRLGVGTISNGGENTSNGDTYTSSLGADKLYLRLVNVSDNIDNITNLKLERVNAGSVNLTLPTKSGKIALTDVNLTFAVPTSLGDSGYYTYSGAGAVSWQLPALPTTHGRKYTVMNISGDTLTVNVQALDFIRIGTSIVTSIALAPGENATLYNNGNYWMKLN